MIIKADLHTHTERSFDGRQSLSALAGAAKARGLQAVAVTEHGIYHELPESLDGILLIPGCEFYTPVGHMTGLFLEQPPKTEGLTSAEETIAEIHRCGGIAIMAHPFQKGSHTEQDFAFSMDGLETANARAYYKNKSANDQASALAAKRGLPTIGGSDAHSAKEVGNAYTEIRCDALTPAALKQAILAGNCRAVLMKNTPRRMIGLSQLTRRRRMGGWKNLSIGLTYLLKSILIDIKER